MNFIPKLTNQQLKSKIVELFSRTVLPEDVPISDCWVLIHIIYSTIYEVEVIGQVDIRSSEDSINRFGSNSVKRWTQSQRGLGVYSTNLPVGLKTYTWSSLHDFKGS